MNIGQRPLSVGEEETHMSPNIVTRDNNRYTLFHAFVIFTHAYLFSDQTCCSKYMITYLVILHMKTLPAFINLSSNQEGTSIFDVLRLNAQTKNVATLKMVC